MLISPSALAIAAAGIAPEGTLACPPEHDGEPCAVCGVPLRAGDPVDRLSLPPSFTNHAALAVPGGNFRCGACTAVMTRDAFQMMASTVLIARDGIFPIVRKENRAWAFLTPPEPPFVIAIQNAKQQHVIWRAPVTLSRDLLLVRVGEQVVRIRRPLLSSAAKAATRLDSLRRTPGRPVRDGIENPFVNDWKLQSCDGGRLKGWVFKMLQDGVITPDDLRPLLALNAGEAWALTAALYAEPSRPESISI